MPAWRTFVLPVDEVTIHDTWNPMGLAGTGSHDYSVDGVWVPDEHGMQPLEAPPRDEPLYALPWSFIVKGAAVPIGLARRALDELVAIAPGKLVFPEFAMLGDLDHLHDHLARSRALIASARTLIHDVVGGRVGRDRAHRRAPPGGPGRPPAGHGALRHRLPHRGRPHRRHRHHRGHQGRLPRSTAPTATSSPPPSTSW